MKHNKQEVTVYGDDHKESHEIYVVFLPDSLKILYIGEGLKGRHKHTFSGKSHVRALNTIHKRGVSIRVDVMGVKDKDRGIFLEDALIKALQPRYNVVAKEFYLNSVVKDALTPFLRDDLTLHLREVEEITSEPLKEWLEERSKKILNHRKELRERSESKAKEETSKSQREEVIIKAPEGVKYLSDVLPEKALPRNCIFNKVLTGCGGSYVALTSSEPYIIAVPTKSLVRDKVTSEQYKPYKIQGVSEDYPLGKRRLYLFDKIIVTYKSLPKVAEKVDISKYNLLIDEMHMLVTMTGYARQELSWILNNFKSFKSYCFMSATVPRSEHLLEELKDLPVVGIEWSDIARVDFECLLSSNVTSSLLRVLLEHQRGERVGTPYVFYNSVSGICDIVSRWKSSKIPARFNIICADTKANIKRLKEVREDLGKPNRKADFHFITATAFEGVDFYAPDGVTYIISNNLYYSTKYSIETTIPQIVGRLRDSKFNRHITLIYNQHAKTSDMSPREFSKQC